MKCCVSAKCYYFQQHHSAANASSRFERAIIASAMPPHSSKQGPALCSSKWHFSIELHLLCNWTLYNDPHGTYAVKVSSDTDMLRWWLFYIQWWWHPAEYLQLLIIESRVLGSRIPASELPPAVANESQNTEQFMYFPTVLGTILSCLQTSICVLLQ